MANVWTSPSLKSYRIARHFQRGCLGVRMSIIAQFQTMCCWGRKPAVSEVILLHGVCFLAVNLSIRVALLCQGHSESVVSLACSGFKELPMTGIYGASMFHLGFMMVLEDWAGR